MTENVTVPLFSLGERDLEADDDLEAVPMSVKAANLGWVSCKGGKLSQGDRSSAAKRPFSLTVRPRPGCFFLNRSSTYRFRDRSSPPLPGMVFRTGRSYLIDGLPDGRIHCLTSSRTSVRLYAAPAHRRSVTFGKS